MLSISCPFFLKFFFFLKNKQIDTQSAFSQRFCISQHGISIYVYVHVCNEICYIQTGIDVDRKIQNGTLYIPVILWCEPQHY